MSTDAEPLRPRGLTAAIALVCALAATLDWVLVRTTGIAVFAALGGLAMWALVVALTHTLPRLPGRIGTILGILGFLAAGGLPAFFHLRQSPNFFGATESLLQLTTVALALLAFGFHFLATYSAHTARTTPAPALATLVPLLRLLAAAHALTVGALILRLYTRHNALQPAAVALNAATAILLTEAALRTCVRLYQPPRLRAADPAFGHSVVLPLLFGESGPLRSLGAGFERAFGIRLSDTWLVRLAHALVAPLILLGTLGLWASTGVTRVPLESRGVLLQRGAFAPDALPPGLHFHAPWPWAAVVVVSTERIEELALGFERDLDGPVLWTEKHFEGEQNLLVGQGEELLTLNVPIHYRVRNAVTFLKRTGQARAALEALGYHELLALTTTHTAFGLMTTDRAEIAGKLHANLQSAADRLDLGIEIVFVGLKDVHPPVSVAPDYQDVVSAEEQRVALSDLARTYVVQATAAAEVNAMQLRLQAESAATARHATAVGEAARWTAPLAAYHARPDVFTTRRRLETLESVLADVRQLILVPPALRARAHFYQGIDASGALAPALAR